MAKRLSDKENLWRALTRSDPQRVPVRRMNGTIPGMARLFYHASRGLLHGTDRWGVQWAGGLPAGREWEPEVMGYAIHHPLADISRLDDYAAPDPREPGIMDGLLDGIDRDSVMIMGELPLVLWERAYLLVGMETLFMAMATDPDVVRPLFGQIVDYQIGIIRRYAELGVDAIRSTDDYGTQTSLLMSPGLWRTLIKPELRRIFAAAKDAGLMVFHHSCGHIEALVPDLIEIGVDVLDPVQASANDQLKLKRSYGDRLSFLGGVSSQQALSRGTEQEVEAEVRRCIQTLGPGGGYILGPDNFVPIAEANYRAYLAAGERYGLYPLQV